MVDKEVSHLLVKKEAEEELASLQQRKEALMAERDDKQQQRNQLELQLVRSAQNPGHSALRRSASASASATEHTRHEQEHEHEQGQSQGQTGAALQSMPVQQSSSSQAEGDRLQLFQQGTDSKDLPLEQSSHAELDSGWSSEPQSSEEQNVQRQAAALDDAVDTCDAQMRYLDSAVADCKTVSALHADSESAVRYTCLCGHCFCLLLNAAKPQS